MNPPIDEGTKKFAIIVEEDWIRVRVGPDCCVTSELIFSILKELYSLEAYRSEKIAGLWDFRGCHSDIDYEKMDIITNYISLHYDSNWSHTYTAIVADEDLIYGLSRMYEMMTSHMPTITHIFRDMDDAKQWLTDNTV